jgi:hypothetical protein
MTRKRLTFTLALSAVALAAALGAPALSCGTTGCTPENCEAMISTCRMELDADPSSYCLRGVSKASGVMPATPAEQAALTNASCAKACERNESGSLVSCMVANKDACVGSTPSATAANSQSVADKCVTKKLGSHDPNCVDACYATFKTCVAACPMTSLAACLPCGDACSDTYIKCGKDC